MVLRFIEVGQARLACRGKSLVPQTAHAFPVASKQPGRKLAGSHGSSEGVVQSRTGVCRWPVFTKRSETTTSQTGFSQLNAAPTFILRGSATSPARSGISRMTHGTSIYIDMDMHDGLDDGTASLASPRRSSLPSLAHPDWGHARPHLPHRLLRDTSEGVTPPHHTSPASTI